MEILSRLFGNFKDRLLPETEELVNNNNQDRKRSAPYFEPELTDDEGDVPSSAHLFPKRMKPSSYVDVVFPSSSIFPNQSPKRHPHEKIHTINVEKSVTDDQRDRTPSRNSAVPTPTKFSCFSSFFSSKKKGGTSNKYNTVIKKPLKAKKPNHSSILDRIRHTNWLKTHVYRSIVTDPDTIRLKEKAEYQALVEQLSDSTSSNFKASPFCRSEMREFGHNSTLFSQFSSPSGNSNNPLTYSKEPQSYLEKRFSTWDIDKPHSVYLRPVTSTPKCGSSSGNSYTPRLFTSPTETSYFPSPRSALRPQRIETVDLTNGDEEKDSDVIEVSPPSRVRSPVVTVTPYTSPRPSAVKIDQLGQHIQNVLDKSFGPKEVIELNDDDDANNGKKSPAGRTSISNKSNHDDDDDIQVLSESLKNKSPKNSLALELNNFEFTRQQWLAKSQSSFTESQKQKQNDIEREMATLKILQNESTIDSDLDARVRRSLQLTDIIVLEPPKEEKPEITEEMYNIIKKVRNVYNQKQVLTTTPNNIEIVAGDIKSLGPQQWLNDNKYLCVCTLKNGCNITWGSIAKQMIQEIFLQKSRFPIPMVLSFRLSNAVLNSDSEICWYDTSTMILSITSQQKIFESEFKTAFESLKVINSYLDMIALRSKTNNKLPSVYVFTTFFYTKYIKEGYSNMLKRWTRKVDLFTFDLLIFPIHLGVHWCLAVADMRRKTIKYYDSMGGKNYKCVKALLDYLNKEHMERKKEPLKQHEWETIIVEDIPQQQNGSDCGMFACKFAEYLSRDSELTFKQEDMNYYRERMIYEIVEQELLFP